MIRTTEKLREIISVIRLCEKDIDNFADREMAEKLIARMKRDVRDYYKETPVSDIVHGDWDSYVRRYKLPIPGDWSKDNAVEYFEAREFVVCPNSQYDCTGRPFTSWYHLFQRHGEWWCYHCIGIDV